MNEELVSTLRGVADERQFGAGDTIRVKGAFAPDMLLVLEGEAEVILDADEGETVSIARHSLIGEMGYVSGQAANAEVRALTNLRALVLDNDTLSTLEKKHREHAVLLSKTLARTIAAREAHNAVFLEETDFETSSLVEVRRCVNADDLLGAQQTRYAVYCGEFNRPSPNADHDKQVIIDELDTHGTSFLAIDEGEVVGTVRINLARDGALGILPELYGMLEDNSHPQRSCIITKYAIKEAYRGGTTYMRLFAAIAGFVNQGNLADKIFIDCVPTLARFYATMGFERSSEDFLHYENGLSVPMVLDLPRYFSRMPFEERFAKNRWR